MRRAILTDEHIIGEPGDAYLLKHLAWSYAIAGALQAAVRVGLFDALAVGLTTVDAVAHSCAMDRGNTEKLLVACTAMGLVDKEGELYHNTPASDRYLVSGRAGYQGELIEHQARQWVRWGEIDHFVRTGARGPRELAVRESQGTAERDRERWIWMMAMHNIAMSGQGDALVRALDLSECQHLCDVGGGPGTYALFLCQKWPQLTATVLDLPQTRSIAESIIDAFELGHRVRFRAADYLEDDYGRENGAVLLSGVLHGETPSDCKEMLGKAFDSLAPGGQVMVQEVLLNEQKTGPLLPALFSLHMSYGASYSGSEIAGWMEEAGFVAVQVHPLHGYSWLNGLVVGRKPG